MKAHKNINQSIIQITTQFSYIYIYIYITRNFGTK